MRPLRVNELLERAAERTPTKTALVASGSRVTYSELNRQASDTAHALTTAGLRQGDRVIVSFENSIEGADAIFAVAKAGGVFVPISPRARPERMRQFVADSGAAFLLKASSLVNLRAGHEFSRATEEPADPDLAALIYTSGSTGEPKGVMLTHQNITFQAAAVCEYLENTAADVILNVLPMTFVYGLSQLTTACHVGATLVLERSFAYPAAVLDVMARERVTGFPLVPTIATVLLQHDLQKRPLPALRYLTNAAAALSKTKIAGLRKAFPGVRLYSMYGLTECRVCYLPPDQLDSRPDSVGVPIPGTDAVVVDEAGRPVPAGVTGELVVTGPHVMKGYWHKPEATANALRQTADGRDVLYTGDLFRADCDGYLYFVDRKDDLIKTRGEKVAPRQVEEVIAQLPGVAEVAVFGVPDELMGQAIAAAISLVPGTQLSADQIKRHCLTHLEAFMIPSVVQFRPFLPLTASGKVSRRELHS